jgi:two-component system response regulator
MNKPYILIAEDDVDDRYLMKTALSDSGITEAVTYVENGVEVIGHLEAVEKKNGFLNYPRFIILDLNMPKMDGREVLKRLKTDDVYKNIPIIVFSTTKNQIEVNRCYELGANTYIIKPARYDTLVEAIKQIYTYWCRIATLI